MALSFIKYSSTHTPLILVSLILVVLCIVFVCCYRRRMWRSRKRKAPPPPVVMNWPALGMFPGILVNSSRINDFLTECLEQGGGTFELKGPCFANVDFLLTCDPANVHYVLSKNFSNFSKGPEFNKFFDDVLGDGIFNAVSKSWEEQRKTAMSLLNHQTFQNFVATTSWNKVKTGLIPILDYMADLGTEFDLQDLFKRLTFDTTCILVLGHDPASLSIHLPHTQCLEALSDAEEAVFYRHVFPEFWWRFQRWLQIGREKKLRKGRETLDQFLAQCLSLKKHHHQQQQRLRSHSLPVGKEGEVAAPADMLSSYMQLMEQKLLMSGGTTASAATAAERLLRDTLLNMLFAGTDTISSALTWFFWLLAVNPSEEIKIRQEIDQSIIGTKEVLLISSSSNDKLVYLHGALCESLRLFPPVPLQHKSPIEADILPSGHHVDKNSKTLLCFYSMARMESIWGKDCYEFKPERWISESGRLKHEPSFRFPAFNAGPRSCVGKETSFLQLKIVAATVLRHFNIKLVKGHPISPSESVILHMKHGLKVRLTKTTTSVSN